MREPRQDQVVEIAQERFEGLPLFGRRGGKRGPDRAGLDPGRDRQLADPPQVRVGPVGGQVEVVTEGHRFLRSFSICFHVRVLRTSSFVSQARRAWPTPSST